MSNKKSWLKMYEAGKHMAHYEAFIESNGNFEELLKDESDSRRLSHQEIEEGEIIFEIKVGRGNSGTRFLNISINKDEHAEIMMVLNSWMHRREERAISAVQDVLLRKK